MRLNQTGFQVFFRPYSRTSSDKDIDRFGRLFTTAMGSGGAVMGAGLAFGTVMFGDIIAPHAGFGIMGYFAGGALGTLAGSVPILPKDKEKDLSGRALITGGLTGVVGAIGMAALASHSFEAGLLASLAVGTTIGAGMMIGATGYTGPCYTGRTGC